MIYRWFCATLVFLSSTSVFAPTVYEHGTNAIHYHPPTHYIIYYDAYTGRPVYSSTPYEMRPHEHFHATPYPSQSHPSFMASTHHQHYHPRNFNRHFPPNPTSGVHPANLYPGFYDKYGNYYFHYKDHRDWIVRTCYYDGTTTYCHY